MNSAPSQRRRHVRRVLAVAIASAATVFASIGPAAAQTTAAGDTAMVRLIRGLIQSGALARDVGEALLAQAQSEAAAAQPAARPAPAAGQAALRPEPGDVRVPHVPQTVRDQIRDEVKVDVMARARAEGWAAPNATPAWTQRIRVEGDVRVRGESRFFADGNSNIEIDWRAINGGDGFDTNTNTNLSLPPLLNTRKDRKNLLRNRARLGVHADITDVTKAGVRLATGNDESPVSTTQTLGGGLAKKDIWLDQAWLSHQPLPWLTIQGGRFGNPFMSSDVLFSNDLNFDGIAARVDKPIEGTSVSVFGTVGAIPLEYSSDGFPSTSQDKASSKSKWLFGAQVGAQWRLGDTDRLRGAVAYYDFDDVTGRVSQPCALYAGADHCSTDWSRPAFMQKGNTLMLLRNIATDPADPANTPMPQYVGLASKFQLLDINLRWDTRMAGGLGLRLDGNFIRNLAYDEGEMWSRSRGGIVNNFGAGGGSAQDAFESGGTAYMLQSMLGDASPARRGDWNALLGYKRIEPDALPDAYNDSSFHLGGTNARGYYLGGSYAVDRDLWFTGRWTSTKEVYGPPLAIDLLQLEFNARF